jgi:hypothetical protein
MHPVHYSIVLPLNQNILILLFGAETESGDFLTCLNFSRVKEFSNEARRASKAAILFTPNESA